MRWNTEWEIDSHLFRQHLSAMRSHTEPKMAHGPLKLLGCSSTAATPSYCIWQPAHGCNLFLVRVNNFWMWRHGQAEVVVRHLGANNYFLTSVHSLPSRIHFISEVQSKWQNGKRCNNKRRKAARHSVHSHWTVRLIVSKPGCFIGLDCSLSQGFSHTVTSYYLGELAVTVHKNIPRVKTRFANCWNFTYTTIYYYY